MGKFSEIFNFDNIGGKIKNFAKWSCWITIILFWIAEFFAFISLVSDDRTVKLFWIPLVSAIIVPIFVWIGSWTMYAFGELVEDVHAMRNKEGTVAEEKANRETEEIAQKKTQTFFCPKCSNIVNYGEVSCSSCGQQFDWSKK